MEAWIKDFLKENIIFSNEKMDTFLFRIQKKNYILSWSLSYEKVLKEDAWINPLTQKKDFLPKIYYEKKDFYLISVNRFYSDITTLIWYYKKIKENYYPLMNVKQVRA